MRGGLGCGPLLSPSHLRTPRNSCVGVGLDAGFAHRMVSLGCQAIITTCGASKSTKKAMFLPASGCTPPENLPAASWHCAIHVRMATTPAPGTRRWKPIASKGVPQQSRARHDWTSGFACVKCVAFWLVLGFGRGLLGCLGTRRKRPAHAQQPNVYLEPKWLR